MKRLFTFFSTTLILTLSGCEITPGELDNRPANPSFEFKDDPELNIKVDAVGDTVTFKFETNCNWKITKTKSWVSVDPESGTPNDGKFTITVKENKKSLSRSETVTVHYGDTEEIDIKIKQAAYNSDGTDKEDDGTGEGEDDGTGEGEDDGSGEGEDDGSGEGEDDGSGEGEDDGSGEGEDDGSGEGEDDGSGEGDDEGNAGGENNDYPDTCWAAGELAWVFDMNEVPEIRIDVTVDEWNDLLRAYDQDSNTSTYIHCDAEFKSKGETHFFEDAGLRLRGNTSRRRPEGNGGEMHKTNNADWHHCHFMLNLRKYQKDDAHELYNVRKLYLKWHKDDSAYCREIYSYDLFRRFGIWTAAYSSYCRLWIHVEGDSQPAYYGVYEMIEAIDDKFVKKRKSLFGDHNHNLWKCRWGATLNYHDIYNASIYYDDDSGSNYTYELKSNTSNFNAAKTQLIEFTRNLTERTGQDFHDWIASVCDVRLLLRTYAVNVVLGMWDDYWNNCNNFYIYFNSSDKDNYKFFFIPFDYDNTLGTSSNCGVQSDSARHDPLRWGDTGKSPLIGKILEFDDYRAIYIEALNELCSPSNDLFYWEYSIARINGWHAMIRNYVDNDTEEDCEIKDRPASWGNHYEYRLLDSSEGTNFFRLKAASIPQQ